MNENRIRDFAIATILSAILLFFGVSSLGLFLIFYTIPQLVLGYKYKHIDMILSLTVSNTVLLPIFPGITPIIIFIISTVWASVLLYSFKNKYSYIKNILIGTAIMAVLIFVSISLINKINNTDILNLFKSEIDLVINRYMDILKSTGKVNMELVDDLYKNIKMYLIVTFPSIIMVMTFIYTLVNITLVAFVLRKMKIVNLELYNFFEFKLPNNFLIGILISFVSIALIKYFKIEIYEEVSLNLILIYSTLIGVEGMAVADFFFKLKRSLVFRILMPIMIIFVFRFYQLYIIIGIVNLIFKFRERYKKERINK